MNQKQKILFITDKNYVDYEIPGGVQICTEEFIRYFETAGYEVLIFKVSPLITPLIRLKLKFGFETYELYNPKIYLPEIASIISKHKIKFILFNQLNLAHWATKIRETVPYQLKCIGLSHGNESGDYLYEITKKNKKPTLLKTWRIGKLIIKEKSLFSKTLDAVITISEQESYINQWLGAEKILFLPRILEPKFIDWQPEKKTIGFVGTLDHYPNYGGIEMLANQLHEKLFDGTLKLIGGPKKIGEQLAKQYSFISYCGQLTNKQLPSEISKLSIFVNPIFWHARGSSTKIAQIINWGIPILSTKAGVRGYNLVNTDFVSEENTPDSLTLLILDTLKSTEKLDKLQETIKDNATGFLINTWASKLHLFLEKL